MIGLYKTEVICRRGPWRHLEAVEFATLEWVDWFNHRRLLTPIGNVPPAEFEQQYYLAQEAPVIMAGVQLMSSLTNPGRFKYHRLRRERARQTLRSLYGVFPPGTRSRLRDASGVEGGLASSTNCRPDEARFYTSRAGAPARTADDAGKRLGGRWRRASAMREVTRLVERIDFVPARARSPMSRPRFDEATTATLPGIGWITIAGLIEIGPFDRYQHRQLVKLAGLH